MDGAWYSPRRGSDVTEDNRCDKCGQSTMAIGMGGCFCVGESTALGRDDTCAWCGAGGHREYCDHAIDHGRARSAYLANLGYKRHPKDGWWWSVKYSLAWVIDEKTLVGYKGNYRPRDNALSLAEAEWMAGIGPSDVAARAREIAEQWARGEW